MSDTSRVMKIAIALLVVINVALVAATAYVFIRFQSADPLTSIVRHAIKVHRKQTEESERYRLARLEIVRKRERIVVMTERSDARIKALRRDLSVERDEMLKATRSWAEAVSESMDQANELSARLAEVEGLDPEIIQACEAPIELVTSQSWRLLDAHRQADRLQKELIAAQDRKILLLQETSETWKEQYELAQDRIDEADGWRLRWGFGATLGGVRGIGGTGMAPGAGVGLVVMWGK